MTIYIELGLYRIKSHCSYDLESVQSTDFSIFQVEIMDAELQSFYKGTHILEIWNKKGERLYQRVLSQEIKLWKLLKNVLVFKDPSENDKIFVVFLDE